MTTIEISEAMTPDQIIKALRKQAPELVKDEPVTIAPARAPAAHRSPRYQPAEAEPLLTPAEVAVMFRCDPKTVTRWAKAGKLTSIRTLGGHRRYRETEVRALLAGVPQSRSE